MIDPSVDYRAGDHSRKWLTLQTMLRRIFPLDHGAEGQCEQHWLAR
jgi:hypothetical protein